MLFKKSERVSREDRVASKALEVIVTKQFCTRLNHYILPIENQSNMCHVYVFALSFDRFPS